MARAAASSNFRQSSSYRFVPRRPCCFVVFSQRSRFSFKRMRWTWRSDCRDFFAIAGMEGHEIPRSLEWSARQRITNNSLGSWNSRLFQARLIRWIDITLQLLHFTRRHWLRGPCALQSVSGRSDRFPRPAVRPSHRVWKSPLLSSWALEPGAASGRPCRTAGSVSRLSPGALLSYPGAGTPQNRKRYGLPGVLGWARGSGSSSASQGLLHSVDG